MDIDPNCRDIMRTLVSKGFQAYAVGGAIRDSLLGLEAHDWDIATSATPEQTASLFSRTSSVGQGLKHGTVVVAIGNHNYEVTTFRKDVTSDGRHSEIAYASTIQEDLSRRDFSVNALALDLDGNLIDLFGGQKDLQNKVLRTVGDAETRFNEDRLRMLRAVRFSAHLSLDMDPTLLDALRRGSDRITTVSVERHRDEIVKMLSNNNVLVALTTLRDTGLLAQIMPEIAPTFGFPQNRYHQLDVFNHMATACAALPKEKPLLRLAALVHDISKPETCEGKGTPEASFHGHEIVGAKKVQKLMTRMTFSSADTDRVSNLVRYHMFRYDGDMTDGAIRRLVRNVGLENVQDLIEIKWADRVGKGPGHYTPYNPNTNLRKHVDRLVAEESAFGLKDLEVNGTDLMEGLGLEPGPVVGKTLNALLEKVLDNTSLNEKNTLLDLAKEICDL